jgi:hypothetical protein
MVPKGLGSGHLPLDDTSAPLVTEKMKVAFMALFFALIRNHHDKFRIQAYHQVDLDEV